MAAYMCEDDKGSRVDPKTLELLNSADWRDLALKLLPHARARVTCWPNTGGHTAEDIVQMAIERTYAAKRKWDPSKVSLETHLHGVVHSLAGPKGVFGKEENSMLEHVDPAKLPESADESNDSIIACDRDAAFNALMAEVSGHKELADMLAAIEMGAATPEAVAAFTGYDIKRVYELRRKMIPYVERAARRLRA